MKIILLLIFTNLLLFGVQPLKKVSIQLSWFNQFQFAGYYMAKEKGFYEELGLDVEIKPFQFGLDIPRNVNNYEVDFAIGRETLILEKLNNQYDISVLYALFQSSPLVLLTTKESGINNLEDFYNKKIMTTLNDASEVSLKAMLSSSNVQQEDLTFLKHSHNINDLIDKKTDIISAYISKSPFKLKEKLVNYNIFEPKKYGFDMYSDFLYTNKHLIINDPKTVNDFKKASLRGWKYAYSNINESANLILSKYNTQNLSLKELLYEAIELKKLSYYDTDELGKINTNKLQRIYDLYKIMGLVKSKENLNDFLFTNDSRSFHLTKKEKEYLKKKKYLNICTTENLMPYSDVDKNGDINGIIKNVVALISEKTDIKTKVVRSINWKNTLDKIKHKECDIIPFAINIQSRINNMNFTQAYFTQPIVIATRNDELFIEDSKHIKNREIGVFKDSAIIEIIKENNPNLKIVTVKSPKEGLEMVSNGELFAYVDSLVAVAYHINKTHFYNLKITGKLEITVPFSMVSRNDEPILNGILQKVIDVSSKKEKDSIVNEWLLVKFEDKSNYDLIIKIISVFIIIIFIFIVLLIKQRKLRNEIIELNRTLERRISEEVEKNREKDNALFRQSKFASMGEMIGNIAHQWRQPLNRINLSLSVISVLSENDKLDKKIINEKVESAEKNIKYMSETIEDFANFFRPDKKKTIFYITNTIERSLKLLEGRTQEIDIILPLEKNIKLYNYENEFLQVLLVILNNAIDNFNITSVENKKISICLVENINAIELSICDNGGGIAFENIEKIFEPYFTTKFKKEGTGIGLYMAKMIVEKSMSSELSVSSIQEHSTFIIKLNKYTKRNYE